MRSLVLLLLTATLCVAVSGQTTRDVEHDRLLGPVQTVTTEVAELTTKDGKSVEGPRVPLRTLTYDARGNRVKQIYFNRDGSVAQTIVFNYNTEGRIVGYEDYVAGLTTPRKHIYTLDQNGNPVEYRIVQPTGKDADEKYVFKYDDKKNRVAEELYHKTTLITRNENTYDEHGRLTSQVSYNPDSTVSTRIRVSFAADGKPVERIRHDGDLLTYHVRYTYDNKRRLLEVETIGSYVDTDSTAESHISGKVVYVYKSKHQPKEMLIYNPDGSLRARLLLEYDSRGNWTKRTHRVKAAPATKETTRQIDYRTITYHH